MRPGARALILTADRSAVGQVLVALRQAGVDWVSLAETVAEAVQHCAYGGHSLAVVDRDLDAIDGMDFVHALRRAPDHPSYRMPIIMVSSRATAADASDALAAGVTAYLAKPISVDMLSACVVQVFNEGPAAP